MNLGRVLIFCFIFFVFTPELIFAGQGGSVIRGGSITIYWSVQGSPNCSGTTPYPNISGENVDNQTIQSFWINTAHNGTDSKNFPSVRAAPGTYDFTCTARDANGQIIDQDTSILTVLDCPGGTTWNGSSCATTPPGGNAPTVDIGWTPSNTSPGGYGTVSWTSNNATYCDFFVNGTPFANTNIGWPFNNPSGWAQGPLETNQTWAINCTNAFGSAYDAATITVAPAVNNATCAASNSYTVPVGSQFTLSQTMTNSGTKPWTNDSTPHKLGTWWEDSTFGSNRIATVSGTINQYQTYNFSGTLTAPTTPGTYTLNLRMLEEGVEWFGGICPVTIVVNAAVPPVPTCTSSSPASPSTTGSSMAVYAYGVTNASIVYFPTWSDSGGQDDLIWYPGTNLGGGTWSVTVPFSSHGNNYGTYSSHVYMNGTGGYHINTPCGTANFTREAPAPIPTVKPNITGSCPAPGNVATVNVSSPDANTTSFAYRLNDYISGWACPNTYYGDKCLEGVSKPYTDTIGGLNPERQFDAWAHPCNASGCNYAAEYQASVNFTCLATPVTGSISGTSCTIPVNGSSCSGSLTWSTANATAPSVQWNNGVVSTAASGTNVPVNLPGLSQYTSYIFNLHNGGTILSAVTLTATCATGSSWSNGICAINPCTNGATNPPTCNQCPANYSLVNGQCQLNPPTCSSSGPNTAYIVDGNTMDIYAYGVQNATVVKFPTWTINNGQDDLASDWPNNQSIRGQNLGGGTWRYTVNFSGNPPTGHYNEYGAYASHIYMDNSANSNIWCGTGDFTRVRPVTTTVNVTPSAVNTPSGFRVTMSSTNATYCSWTRSGSYAGNWTNQPLNSGTSYDSGDLYWGEGNATWEFTCSNGGSFDTKSGSVTVTTLQAAPTLNVSATSQTNINIANWNCNSASAQSGIITRSPGPNVGNVATTGSNVNQSATQNTTYTYTLTCYAGLNGTGSVTGSIARQVTTPQQTSVSLTANNCTINNNQSSCTSNVSWTTSGYTNPYFGWCTQPNCTSPGTQNGASGNRNFTLTGNPAISTYVYVNGNSGTVAATTIRGNCGANQVWNPTWQGTGACRPATCPNGAANYPTCAFVTPTLTLNAVNPSTISVGWNCNSVNALSANFVRTPSGSTLGDVAITGSNVPDSAQAGTNYTYAITCWSNSQAGQGQITGSTSASILTPNYPTIVIDCGNGSSNYPNCNECPSGQIFDGVRCVVPGAGLSCAGVTNPVTGYYSFPTCGNGTIESGEECDGTIGITSSSSQQCSNSCTITCKNGSSNTPNCGSCPSGQVSVNGLCVTQCTNGALQTSAPACNTCPTGQIYAGGRCLSPICGNNVIEGSEQCDGTAGITSPGTQACTYGCCLQAATTTLSSFRVTCTDTTNYNIVKISDGSTVIQGGYTGTFIFSPVQADTYRVTCLNQYASTNTLVTASTMQAAPVTGMTLTANPKTIRRNSSTALSFTTPSPTTLCKIIATPTITTATPSCNSWCVIQRLNEAARLNTALSRGVTDSSDPYGAGRLMSSAITTAVGGGETKARGKKSVQLKYSQIFISSCGVNPLRDTTAPRVKVQVTEDIEG